MTAQPRLRIEPRALPTQASQQPSAATAPVPARQFSLIRIAGRFVASGFTMMALTVAVAGAFEYLQPNDHLKPSYLVGNLTGRLAAEELASVEKAKAAFAEGVKTGELKAQIQYDAKLARIEVAKQNAIQVLQTDLNQSTAAWEAAYQLTNAALQGAMQMEASLNQIRASSVAQSQGAKTWFANAADVLGVLGAITGDSTMARVNGNGIRSEMAGEITRAGTQDAGVMAKRIMGQFPNPSQFRIEREGALRQAWATMQQQP